MPFEGDISRFTIMPPVTETPAQRTIRQARELIASPDRWARTWESGEARCILGALRYAHNGSAHKPGTGGAQDFVMRVLRRRGYTGITTFNDHHASHGDVLAVLDAAYEAAGKPRGAKLDLSRVPRKPAERPAAPIPITYKAAAADDVKIWVVPRPEHGPRLTILGRAIDLRLLAALSFVRRRLG